MSNTNSQEYNDNGNGVMVLSGKPIVDKDKFLIICCGRGVGHHNQGKNFLNVAKYHIDEIINNKFPEIPRFEADSCEIVSPQDLYKIINYKIHTDPQRDDANIEDEEGYVIDRSNRRIAESTDGNRWYVLNPQNLDEFTEPLIESFPIKKPDPTFMKEIPNGEIHRVSDLKKIFSIYTRIKYVAIFGHGWAGDYDGAIFVGDRAAHDTNLFYQDLQDIEISNVLQDCQIRIFSCRSGFKFNNRLCSAEMFASVFKGRMVYGWGASGGSVFTHDQNYGYSGINKTGKNPNLQKVDSNNKKTWLVANGQPEGWKKYVF